MVNLFCGVHQNLRNKKCTEQNDNYVNHLVILQIHVSESLSYLVIDVGIPMSV